MIIGECPHEGCDEIMFNPIPDIPLPVTGRIECDKCGMAVWIYYSRMDPQAFTPAQFDEAFTIDRAAMSMTRRK